MAGFLAGGNPLADQRPDGALAAFRHRAPAGNFVECAQATFAQAADSVHATD